MNLFLSDTTLALLIGVKMELSGTRLNLPPKTTKETNRINKTMCWYGVPTH